jgi:gamma-glutamylcyclotransferase (GGCT)/AIG2-like uncharacterized protein YtfP
MSTSKSDYLFTYGTLRPVFAPDEIAPVVEKLRSVGEGFVSGVLYDFGDFPGAVLDPLSDRKITGTVFKLPEGAGILRQLDDYEGYDPDDPDKSLFIRSLCSVVLTNGTILECWVYVYNRESGQGRVLINGEYEKKRLE